MIPAAEHARLGGFVRKIRIEQGVSQRELAARLDLPQSFVSKVERGERQLQALEFIEVCIKIGISPGQALQRYVSGEPVGEANKRAPRKKGPQE
ncbi:MAG: helix-turn-helix transcriptional regulator [Armatimonadetes bacterium]|nr:helix-turn-helix transcriptional regulator [Armatimonadota bacterium]